jgi:hypothetical protein
MAHEERDALSGVRSSWLAPSFFSDGALPLKSKISGKEVVLETDFTISCSCSTDRILTD